MSMNTVLTTTALLDEARAALDRRDYVSAISAADQVIQANARIAKAWRIKLGALRKVGNVELAEEVSQEAIRLFPNADWPLSEHAQVAVARGSTEEAMDRFSSLRNRFAGSAAGYTGAIRLAFATSKPGLAQTLLAEGLKQLPDSKQLLRLSREAIPQESAIADSRATVVSAQDPKTALTEILKIGRRESRRKINRTLALSMFDVLHKEHPDFPPGYAAHIEFLLQMDRIADAASLALLSQNRFPNHLAIGVATIRALAAAGELERALSLALQMQAKFSDAAAVYGAHIHILANAGRESEAEVVAKQALTTWPKDAAIWREYARLATRQGNWTAALDRWLEAQRQRPEDKRIARQVQMAQAQVCVDVPAEASASMFDQFESLGGEAPGCEFGMVQREQGAISVGLLRWAAISPEKLIEALDSNLEGFGSNAQTKLIEVTEYYGLRDTRYELFTHTFVKRADAPFDKMFIQSCRRMRFLADKLRDQLMSGEKIFVYKSIAPMQDQRLCRLHDALQRRGGRALMCLQLANERQAAGSVRIIRPNLFMGYVGFFLNGEPVGDGDRFDIPSYIAICSQVAALTSTLSKGVDLAHP